LLLQKLGKLRALIKRQVESLPKVLGNVSVQLLAGWLVERQQAFGLIKAILRLLQGGHSLYATIGVRIRSLLDITPADVYDRFVLCCHLRQRVVDYVMCIRNWVGERAFENSEKTGLQVDPQSARMGLWKYEGAVPRIYSPLSAPKDPLCPWLVM
jgi:hypothetical protein